MNNRRAYSSVPEGFVTMAIETPHAGSQGGGKRGSEKAVVRRSFAHWASAWKDTTAFRREIRGAALGTGRRMNVLLRKALHGYEKIRKGGGALTSQIVFSPSFLPLRGK